MEADRGDAAATTRRFRGGGSRRRRAATRRFRGGESTASAEIPTRFHGRSTSSARRRRDPRHSSLASQTIRRCEHPRRRLGPRRRGHEFGFFTRGIRTLLQRHDRCSFDASLRELVWTSTAMLRGVCHTAVSTRAGLTPFECRSVPMELEAPSGSQRAGAKAEQRPESPRQAPGDSLLHEKERAARKIYSVAMGTRAPRRSPRRSTSRGRYCSI